MTTPAAYDAIIIGSSRAAIYLSISLAQAGWRTALVERDLFGGTCPNVGCVPTKLMVASARVAYIASRAAEFSVQAGPVSVDLGAVVQRKRDFINGGHRFFEGIVSSFQSCGTEFKILLEWWCPIGPRAVYTEQLQHVMSEDNDSQKKA